MRRPDGVLGVPGAHRLVPGATYRLQLGPECGFGQVAALVPYLADLGVTHLYLSPILMARSGSTHGYDVADPSRVSPALGGEEGLRALADCAHTAGLGLVADIVPNHVGVGEDNPWWEALLSGGRSGVAGKTFDVDWSHPLPGATDKVVLPFLGAQYGEILAAGELRAEGEPGSWRVRYHDRSFPLSPESAAALDRTGVDALHGKSGDRESWQRLHALLEAQHYRLVHWRAGRGLVNYRRFFAVDDLAAVRMEEPAVFDEAHDRILALVADGVLDGLRIDHPDGLRDPGRYLSRLAELSAHPWIVVEKILHPGERLPDWPVAGTTGYEFLNEVLGLSVDPSAEPSLAALDQELGASSEAWAERLRAAKRGMADGDLATDFNRLARALWSLCQRHLDVRDVEERACRELLVRALSEFSAYRTYVDPETAEPRPEDTERIAEALGRVRRDDLVPDFLVEFLSLVLVGAAGDSPVHVEVIARAQQLSAALMAKGIEDTLLYRDLRLTAVNEVGADPARWGTATADFHAANAERAELHPAAMLTTATHDTKRGEDTRLRIAALSELHASWDATVRRWWERHRRVAPDGRVAQLCYQTLVGVWPLDGEPGAGLRERVADYLVKALREAGEATSWRDPDEAYETRALAFLDGLLEDEEFLTTFRPLAFTAAEIAMVSGLSQTLLRVMSPGVPDTYQGTELWDDSLVDPDNRRPVDFALRSRLLAELDAADPAALLDARRDGRVKLWVLSRALRARREVADCFGPGAGYQPLEVRGRWAAHVVAFARTPAPGAAAGPVVTVALRLPGAVMERGSRLPLGDAWEDTTVLLPDGVEGWRDALGGPGADGPGADRPAGAAVPLRELLTVLPVALLEPVPSPVDNPPT